MLGNLPFCATQPPMGILRLALAITVVIAHIGAMPYVGALIGGAAAVQIFFMISGFYMALVLNEKYERAAPFYWARISKLYSFYFVALALAIVVFAFDGKNHIATILASDWDFPSKALALFSNFFIVGSDVMLFTYPSPDGLAFTPSFTTQSPRFDEVMYLVPAWSLPLEMTFYLIAPLVVRRPIVLIGLAVASIVCRYFVYGYFGSSDPWSYRFFPSELIFFVVGVGGYYVYQRIRTWRIAPVIGWAGVTWLLLLMVLIGHYAQITQPVPFSKPGMLFYLSAAAALPFIFAATKTVKIDRVLGEFSYPIYLTHFIVIANFEDLTSILVSAPVLVGLSVAVGVAVTPLGQMLHAQMLTLPNKAFRAYRRKKVVA